MPNNYFDSSTPLDEAIVSLNTHIEKYLFYSAQRITRQATTYTIFYIYVTSIIGTDIGYRGYRL